MTQSLEQALKQVQMLPDADQDTIAALILEELKDEQRWDEAFVKSPGKMEALVQRAREQIAEGEVTEQGMDEL